MVIHRTEQRPIYLHHRVRLGKTLEAFHQLGQLRWVPALNSDTNDRADRELHHFHVVGLLEGGDGSSLHQELVNTHQTADVAAGHVLNGLSVATHHQDGSICRKKKPQQSQVNQLAGKFGDIYLASFFDLKISNQKLQLSFMLSWKRDRAYTHFH